MKQNLIRLYSEPFLNLNENIGISHIRRAARITGATSMIERSFKRPATVMTPRSAAYINEPHHIAQAGVGRPRKFSLCLSSTLNFASLSAENMHMITGIYVQKPVMPPSTSLL